MLPVLCIYTFDDEASELVSNGSAPSRSRIMIKIKRFDHANQMKHCAQYREDVKDLMRISPDVKSSWLQALRKSSLLAAKFSVSNSFRIVVISSSYLPHKPKRQ